jgi:hypothetical protein
MTIQELLGGLFSKIQSEDLDEMVHEIHSEYAAAINNSGVDGQLEFLRQELGDEALLDRIREATK